MPTLNSDVSEISSDGELTMSTAAMNGYISKKAFENKISLFNEQKLENDKLLEVYQNKNTGKIFPVMIHAQSRKAISGFKDADETGSLVDADKIVDVLIPEVNELFNGNYVETISEINKCKSRADLFKILGMTG
jgi:hypothetical protein